jgi:hypothetical protein
MKFHTRYFHALPLSSCEVNENRLSENHTLFEGVNKISPFISTFFNLIWIKFDRKDIHNNVSSKCVFCYNRRFESLTLLRGVTEITCVHSNVGLVLSLARNKILHSTYEDGL